MPRRAGRRCPPERLLKAMLLQILFTITGPGRNTEVDFKGPPRANDTHALTTEPDAPLYKKS